MSTKKNIESPEKLYEYFEKYKRRCKESPKMENFWSSKNEKQVSVTREIPLTWVGFEVWLNKNKILTKLDDYKSNKDNRYSDYAGIIRAIGNEIWEDQFSGATVGVYQHNIIARNLGLADKQEVKKETNKKGVDLSKLSLEELKALKELQDKVKNED